MRSHFRSPLVLLLCIASGCASTPIDGGTTHWDLATVQARESGSPPDSLTELDLAQALELARRWHPGLTAAGARVAAGRGRAQQAGVWANPELELETEGGESGRAAGFGADATFRATLAWEMPLWGAPGLRRAAALAALEGREAAVAQEQRVVEAIVRAMFARAAAADQALALAKQTADLFADAVKSAKERRDAGMTSEPDYIRTAIEHQRTLDALEAADEERALAYAELSASLGLPQLSVGRVQARVSTSWPELGAARIASLATRNAPAVRVAEALVAAAQADVTAAQRDGWPNPELRMGLATARADGDRDTFVEWGIGIPLPVFDRNGGTVREAQATVAEVRADLRAARNSVAAAATRLSVRYARQRSRYLRHRDRLVPDAERSFELIRSGFPAEFSQLELLDSQRTLADARAGLIERRAELASVAAALEALTATSLDALAPTGASAEGENR